MFGPRYRCRAQTANERCIQSAHLPMTRSYICDLVSLNIVSRTSNASLRGVLTAERRLIGLSGMWNVDNTNRLDSRHINRLCRKTTDRQSRLNSVHGTPNTLGCNESVRWEATGGTILQTASQTTNGLHGAYVIIPIFLVLTNEVIFG